MKNPTHAYWDAVAAGASVAELDKLNEERIAFERHQPMGQFIANYEAMGVVCDTAAAVAQVNAEVAAVA